ncbi:MAG: DoxX family protein [Terriglobales bacterium]
MAALLQRLEFLGLLLLRAAVGVVFLWHGSEKLSHLAAWQGNFVHMGFPGYFAYISGSLETLGGALLILGLFARLFGLLLAGEMLIALIRVHWPSGPLTDVGHYQLPMLLSAGAFAVLVLGPGSLAVDRLRGRGRRATARATG